MKEPGPAEFSAATRLSAKALRLWDERGLLVPARPLASPPVQASRTIVLARDSPQR